jgi:hypothetical protein
VAKVRLGYFLVVLTFVDYPVSAVGLEEDYFNTFSLVSFSSTTVPLLELASSLDGDELLANIYSCTMDKFFPPLLAGVVHVRSSYSESYIFERVWFSFVDAQRCVLGGICNGAWQYLTSFNRSTTLLTHSSLLHLEYSGILFRVIHRT